MAGKTAFEILLDRFYKKKSLELQYHNPLGMKIGCSVNINDDLDYQDINFFLDGIEVWETICGDKKFYHTDYLLKGNALRLSSPLRLTLRLLPDENVNNKLGHSARLYRYYDELCRDDSFQAALDDPEGFKINYDYEGNELETPFVFFREGGVTAPYQCNVSYLKDIDGNGSVDINEVEKTERQLWDFARLCPSKSGGEDEKEYLDIQMLTKTEYIMMYIGKDILTSSVGVI
jgi:hypothetical protein